MTYGEQLCKFVKGEYKSIDNTCNGKCSKCGECCGNILPLDQEDINKIQEYVFIKKIHTNKHILVMTGKLQCPYYNGDREKGCSIYEARPKICRFYKCDKKMIESEEIKAMEKAFPVDMWALAEDIEKEMIKYYATNKKTRKTTSKSF